MPEPPTPKIGTSTQPDLSSRLATFNEPSPVNNTNASNIRTRLGVLSNVTTAAVQPVASSRRITEHDPSHVNSMVGSSVKTILDGGGKRARETPYQKDLTPPVAACDPQTPASDASTERPAQKSSNK